MTLRMFPGPAEPSNCPRSSCAFGCFAWPTAGPGTPTRSRWLFPRLDHAASNTARDPYLCFLVGLIYMSPIPPDHPQPSRRPPATLQRVIVSTGCRTRPRRPAHPRPKNASGSASFCHARRTASPLVTSRDYGADVGGSRFLEVDPIEGGSANDYDYVSADPLNMLDLTGERPRLRRNDPENPRPRGGHKKNARKSTKEKHQNADARRQRDQKRSNNPNKRRGNGFTRFVGKALRTAFPAYAAGPIYISDDVWDMLYPKDTCCEQYIA